MRGKKVKEIKNTLLDIGVKVNKKILRNAKKLYVRKGWQAIMEMAKLYGDVFWQVDGISRHKISIADVLRYKKARREARLAAKK